MTKVNTETLEAAQKVVDALILAGEIDMHVDDGYPDVYEGITESGAKAVSHLRTLQLLQAKQEIDEI